MTPKRGNERDESARHQRAICKPATRAAVMMIVRVNAVGRNLHPFRREQ